MAREVRHIWAVLLFGLACAAPALAQGRGGGGFGGGGFGGGGFGGGGFGGGGFGGGGRGGGAGGSDFRTRILERMDSNGNGMLEESEVSERFRSFLEPMLGQSGVPLRFPLSIASVTSGRASTTTTNSNNSASNSTNASADPYPMVAGFGDESILGFGVHPDSIDGRIVDVDTMYDQRVRDMIGRTLERGDKDKNKVLEHEEWANTRWPVDPRELDLNKDGNLTRAELAEYYAKTAANENNRNGGNREGRRGENDGRENGSRGGDRGGRGGRGGRGDSGGGFGGGGFPGGGFPGGGFPGGGFPGGGFPGGGFPGGGFPGGGFAGGGPTGEAGRGGGGGGRGGGFGGFDPSRILERMDEDGDGQIDLESMDERRRGFVTQMLDRFGVDTSRGTVSVEEIRSKIAAAGGGNTDPRKPEMKERVIAASSKIEGATLYKSQSSFRPEKKAPSGVPSWWKDRDKNEDGQVSMAEYLTRENESRLREFEKLDRNQDGIVTPREASGDKESK